MFPILFESALVLSLVLGVGLVSAQLLVIDRGALFAEADCWSGLFIRTRPACIASGLFIIAGSVTHLNLWFDVPPSTVLLVAYRALALAGLLLGVALTLAQVFTLSRGAFFQNADNEGLQRIIATPAATIVTGVVLTGVALLGLVATC